MSGYNRSKEAGVDSIAVSARRASRPQALPFDASPPELHDGPAHEPLVFSIRYSLWEYAGFMWEHGGYIIRRRRLGFLRTYLMLIRSTGAAAFHFAAAGRGKLLYEFTIDDQGIVRSCARGVTLIGWDDVIRIRRYRRGYLMVLKRGTLPIPYRCLGEADVAAMERHAKLLRIRAQRE